MLQYLKQMPLAHKVLCQLILMLIGMAIVVITIIRDGATMSFAGDLPAPAASVSVLPGAK